MKTKGVGQASLKKRNFLEKRFNVSTKGLGFAQKHCVGKNRFSCAKVNLWEKKKNIKNCFLYEFRVLKARDSTES